MNSDRNKDCILGKRDTDHNTDITVERNVCPDRQHLDHITIDVVEFAAA